MADLTVFSVLALFRRDQIRRGSFGEQAYAIGAQALQIVGLVLFLVGAVSALQSAAQLRQFGADIFVANLLGIGLTRELGPLMTAIMVSGRSGSAIAAEIATMKFTEELDALQTMGIDPLRLCGGAQAVGHDRLPAAFDDHGQLRWHPRRHLRRLGVAGHPGHGVSQPSTIVTLSQGFAHRAGQKRVLRVAYRDHLGASRPQFQRWGRGRRPGDDLGGRVVAVWDHPPRRLLGHCLLSEMVTHAIDIQNLCVSYGETAVLRGIDAQVKEGEIAVVLGGSGCGKSTLLKAIIGLVQPASGRVEILGQDATTLGEEELASPAQAAGRHVPIRRSAQFVDG